MSILPLLLEPLTPEAIAPFGAILSAPAALGERARYTDWLGSARPGMTPRLHVNHLPATVLPCRVSTLERHPWSAQCFFPLHVRRYIVVVAPTDAAGAPVLAAARAFLVPGEVGMVYRQNTWHAGATVLDQPGSFAVLMWRNDTDDDERFVQLEQTLEICPR